MIMGMINIESLNQKSQANRVECGTNFAPKLLNYSGNSVIVLFMQIKKERHMRLRNNECVALSNRVEI